MDGFDLYIENNNKLTHCQKYNLKYYNSIKNTFYSNNKTNTQITTFYKTALQNSRKDEISRLELLFSIFMSLKDCDKIINYIKYGDKKDSEIVQFIQSNTNLKYHREFTGKICDKWWYMCHHLVHIFLNKWKIKRLTKLKYIDICCGNAKKTENFYKLLNMEKNNVYCTDIESWGPYQDKEKKKIPFKFKYIKNNKLQYKDNKFHFCTCILSLHHVDKLDEFIDEIYRILKPGGIFLLIEHSTFTDYDKLFVDIQHLLYAVKKEKRPNYIQNPDYIKCYNMYEWNYIMKNHGFTIYIQDWLFEDMTSSNKYDNMCYMFYRKN